MISWEWLGGFFDGEGSVTLIQNHNSGCSVMVDLPQAGPEGEKILKEVKQFLEEQGIITNRLYIEQPKRLSKKIIYRIKITGRKSTMLFLAYLIPHLRIKKIKTQDYLRHLKIFTALPKGGRLTWESRILSNT